MRRRIDKTLYPLIEKTYKLYDKQSQKAELLKRNNIFLSEFGVLKESLPDFSKFQKIRLLYPKGLFVDPFPSPNRPKDSFKDLNKRNPFIKLNYSKYKNKNWITRENKRIISYQTNDFYKNTNSPLIWELSYRAGVFNSHLEIWKKFCARWLISDEWDGALEDLSHFLRNPTEIYFSNPLFHRIEEKGSWAFFIRINASTTLNDIKDKWKMIELIQKRILGKYESKANFGRDLCWHDLKYRHGLSPKQISDLWEKTNPKDIDLLAIKKVKAKEKNDLSEENDIELLEEVTSDPSLALLKEEFDKERENYRNGKYPLLTDVIKKAIKRMDKQIIQITPQSIEEDFLYVTRAKELIRDGKPYLSFKE